jgi:hypothetical protein
MYPYIQFIYGLISPEPEKGLFFIDVDCLFRQDPGHHTEESEAQDGGEYEQLHRRRPWSVKASQRRHFAIR